MGRKRLTKNLHFDDVVGLYMGKRRFKDSGNGRGHVLEKTGKEELSTAKCGAIANYRLSQDRNRKKFHKVR